MSHGQPKSGVAEPATAAPAGNGGVLAFDTPPGWEPRPDPSGMRLASFASTKDPDGDCSVTLFPGGPDSIPANVDRWRKQMGLPPLEPGAAERLPAIDLLGGQGALVELAGSYAGMGGGEARAGWKLLGAIRPLDVAGRPSLVFVKMVGPAALVDGERPAFVALCGSLREAPAGGAVATAQADPHGGAMPADPHGGAMPADPHGGAIPGASPHGHGGADAPGSPLAWKVPDGWAIAPASPARIVTFHAGASGETECYIAVLAGGAGGVAANANRWRGQVGAPPLDDAGIAALPRVTVLGRDAPIVEAAGLYTDMRGAAHPGSALLGTLCPLDDLTVFVKMVGPEAEVRAERARFLAFCGSLEIARR
jgi:hypothetical protein